MNQIIGIALVIGVAMAVGIWGPPSRDPTSEVRRVRTALSPPGARVHEKSSGVPGDAWEIEVPSTWAKYRDWAAEALQGYEVVSGRKGLSLTLRRREPGRVHSVMLEVVAGGTEARVRVAYTAKTT